MFRNPLRWAEQVRTWIVAVSATDLRRHSPGLAQVVPDDGCPTVGRALDLGGVSPDRLAPASQHLVFVPDLFRRPVDVPHVGIAGPGSQGLALPSPTDQDRQMALNRRRLIALQPGVVGADADASVP